VQAGSKLGTALPFRPSDSRSALQAPGGARAPAQDRDDDVSVDWFEGFQAGRYDVNGTRIFARTGGRADGPPLLLLHGFPESHVMWRRVAVALAAHFRLVLADLRGYGDSAAPASDAEHVAYSKRTMAEDMMALMACLGHERFYLAGHDRGGRVAHRLALDHPGAVARLCVIDIAPTLDMYAATDMRFARAYYHWFHLIQPAPLPERMIGGDAEFYLHTKLGGWGSRGLDFIEPQALAEYERCFCRPVAIHAACEDYRASAGIDLEHDQVSRDTGDRIRSDLLVLWGERGVVQALFDPLTLWRAQCAATVTGRALPAGHYIPEELPEATAEALLEFMR
jgi:haloacetate dehalogenase